MAATAAKGFCVSMVATFGQIEFMLDDLGVSAQG